MKELDKLAWPPADGSRGSFHSILFSVQRLSNDPPASAASGAADGVRDQPEKRSFSGQVAAKQIKALYR